jgi:SagB-type dehydrogenase family enzyme
MRSSPSLSVAALSNNLVSNLEESERFHEATKLTKANLRQFFVRGFNYISDPAKIRRIGANFKTYRNVDQISLPKSIPLTEQIGPTLAARRSVREGAGLPIDLQTFSTVIGNALGVTRTEVSSVVKSQRFNRRPYPSPGGLYALEAYVLSLNIEGVKKGIYHYAPASHSLSVVSSDLDESLLREVLTDPTGILEKMSAVVVFTGVWARVTEKYASRGYRFALLEAGAAAQSLSLAATAAGLGTLWWGGFLDDELNSVLGIDGIDETVVNMVFVSCENVAFT